MDVTLLDVSGSVGLKRSIDFELFLLEKMKLRKLKISANRNPCQFENEHEPKHVTRVHPLVIMRRKKRIMNKMSRQNYFKGSCGHSCSLLLHR